jgi:DNA-binding SARP family transcriptional activator
MDYRILGSFEVRAADGADVPLGSGKQRALLALLLLHANETVSSERLVHELWDGAPPPSATKILQNYVSRLRRALGDGMLVTRGHAYELRVERGELDVDRFRQQFEAVGVLSRPDSRRRLRPP